MDEQAVRSVRRFNRTVAERVGALHDEFLGRRRPIGEARLLWEIGPHGQDVRDLRATLNLDSGYASRLLRSLERQGLVELVTSGIDGRVRRARLTPAGLIEREELDRRSNDVASSFLAPLGNSARLRLVTAMTEVEYLIRASEVRVELENPTSPDAAWCMAQYFAELNARFEGGFNPSASLSADPDELTPPRGALFVAKLRGRPVGCGALKVSPSASAEIKRMWVAPEVRGLGVARRLLTDLERYARDAGVRVLRLETNRALTEAIGLYQRNGYQEVAPFNAEPYAHHWFEKDLAVDS